MGLSVIIPENVIETEAMELLSHKFRLRSSSNKEHRLGTIFNFSTQGEMKFTADAYAACDAYGCLMDGGIFYHVFTKLEKDNLVPVDWPDSKDIDGNRISYENYFRNDELYPISLDDGTFMFRIVRAGMGLSNADRLIYQGDLCGGEGQAVQLLTLPEGQALIPKPVEPEA